MAWTTGPRDVFASLPPADRLPKEARDLVEKFQAFNSQAADYRDKAFRLRSDREAVRARYENAIAEAMLNRRKMPVDPLPDYDRGIDDADSRAGGAFRAAGQVYGQLGDLLCAKKPDLVEEGMVDLSAAVEEANEAVENVVGPLLDMVSDRLSVLYWYQNLTPTQAVGYAPGSPERTGLDNGLGQVRSHLRRLRHELAEAQRPTEEVAS